MGVVICSEEIDEGKLSETEGVDKNRSSELNCISVIVGEKISIDTCGGQCENHHPDVITEVNISDKDAGNVSGSKRARSRDDELKSSLVHVAYHALPRKSKKKLEELLLGWSEWHSQHFTNDLDEHLESGEETYYPALQVGAVKSSSLSFLLDVPSIKKHCKGLVAYDKEPVPLYDRGYAAPLSSNDNGSESESRGLEVREDARCFNCGSYDHSLKDCSKPRDNDAITNARKQHQAKKKSGGAPRVPTRYFQESPAGKYDGLKAGSLSAETRKMLGIGEQDLPPWHHRMRELGPSPGYTDVKAEAGEQPSGITMISGDETTEEGKEDTIGLQIQKTDKKKSASFPVLNSPTPKNADTQMWDALDPRVVDIPMKQQNYMANSELHSTRGIDIPMKQPNYMANSELHSRRQRHGPSWADRDYMDSRFTRSFGYHSPPDPFRAERDYRDAGLVGRFGVDPPPGDSNWFDRKYRDERFSGSFRGSPPRNSSWADRDFRDDRFSRSLGVSPPSPNYLSRSYSIQICDGPPRDFPFDHHVRTSPDKWRSWSPYHSPRDHLPFSFSQPHDPPVFTTQTYSHHHLHNSY